MKRHELWLPIITAAWLIALAWWYVAASADCDRRGGTLVRGVLRPFTCVAP